MTGAARAALALLAFAPAAFAQDFDLIKMQLLGKGYTFTEGPAWSIKDGYLIFSDTPGDKLLKWVPGSEVEVFRADAHGPCGNAFDVQGRLYTCETRTRRVTRTDKNGKIEVLADQFEGKHFNAPSHIAVGRNDHVYFTDPAFGSQADHRELDFYGVYHLPPKGPLQLVAKPAGRPTGIALSPNGRILYVANADEHNVRTYDLDKNGEPSGERVFLSGFKSAPLGLTTDEKGDLYVAAGAIVIYGPDGHLIHTIEMHETASAGALGEADLKSLFVTARGNIYRARLDAKE